MTDWLFRHGWLLLIGAGGLIECCTAVRRGSIWIVRSNDPGYRFRRDGQPGYFWGTVGLLAAVAMAMVVAGLTP